MDVIIKNSECPMCGKVISAGKRVKAHLLPKSLKPVHNIFTYLHKECEEKINNLYVNQQKKPYYKKAKKKVLNMIKNLHTGIRILEDKIEKENDNL